MGRAPCCDKANAEKGPWSSEEDAKLKSFINQNGTGGNWITLPRKAGLRRCGKSCRLRWINYLRPDIKHGSFTSQEDRIICQLHEQIGSRWSKICAQLPGRTDNEIKNHWNTRLKKKLFQPVNTNAYHYRHPSSHEISSRTQSELDFQNQGVSLAVRGSSFHGRQLYNMCPLYMYGSQLSQQQFPVGFHPYPRVMEGANGALSLPITLQGGFENQYQQQQQMRTGFVTDNVDETFRNRLLEIQNLLEGDIVAGRTTTSNSDISMDERFRNPDSSIKNDYLEDDYLIDTL
ncbi:hypothetical protein R1flu_001950 [Riccia fluitans]|uniref:Uncharacterized protein n=1 Tax=Riccia fluitans TaxID=41844 RepID=A0ABD1Y4W4_9MARC